MRYLAPHMLNMNGIIEGLEHLANVEFQRKAWLSLGDYPVSSFVEDVCAVFDDSTLQDYIDRGVRPEGFDDEVWSAVGELGAAVDQVDCSLSDESLLEDPHVAEVRERAARVLVLLEERGLTRDVPQFPPDPRVEHRQTREPPRGRRDEREYQLLRMENLVRGLEWLSRLDERRPAWLPADGPAVPALVEAEHVAFMISNLYFHIREDIRPKQLDGRAWSAAKALDAALYEVDYRLGPDELLADPKVARVRELAARLLALLAEAGLTEGVLEDG